MFCIAVVDCCGQWGQFRRERVVFRAVRRGGRVVGKECGVSTRRVEMVWDISWRQVHWFDVWLLFSLSWLFVWVSLSSWMASLVS